MTREEEWVLLYVIINHATLVKERLGKHSLLVSPNELHYVKAEEHAMVCVWHESVKFTLTEVLVSKRKDFVCPFSR